jgi:hypothetical protein
MRHALGGAGAQILDGMKKLLRRNALDVDA